MDTTIATNIRQGSLDSTVEVPFSSVVACPNNLGNFGGAPGLELGHVSVQSGTRANAVRAQEAAAANVLRRAAVAGSGPDVQQSDARNKLMATPVSLPVGQRPGRAAAKALEEVLAESSSGGSTGRQISRLAAAAAVGRMAIVVMKTLPRCV